MVEASSIDELTLLWQLPRSFRLVDRCPYVVLSSLFEAKKNLLTYLLTVLLTVTGKKLNIGTQLPLMISFQGKLTRHNVIQLPLIGFPNKHIIFYSSTSPSPSRSIISYSSFTLPFSLPLYLKSDTIYCLSVGYGVSRSDTSSLMCAGAPGSIPGADKIDSDFHPSGVGKIRSRVTQGVAGWLLQKYAGLSVRPSDVHVWLMQPEAQTTTRGSLAVSGRLRDSDRYSRRLWSVITLPFTFYRYESTVKMHQ